MDEINEAKGTSGEEVDELAFDMWKRFVGCNLFGSSQLSMMRWHPVAWLISDTISNGGNLIERNVSADRGTRQLWQGQVEACISKHVGNNEQHPVKDRPQTRIGCYRLRHDGDWRLPIDLDRAVAGLLPRKRVPDIYKQPAHLMFGPNFLRLPEAVSVDTEWRSRGSTRSSMPSTAGERVATMSKNVSQSNTGHIPIRSVGVVSGPMPGQVAEKLETCLENRSAADASIKFLGCVFSGATP